LKLSLTKWAKADIIRAGGWYEQKRDGLGGEFVYQVDAALSRIARNPAGYAKVVRENRRCTLEQFPYSLWFRIEGEIEVVVVACLHGKRRV
jgi:plasmid stabilization system protein ParE